MSAPLKPCPFCGGASKWRPGVHSPPRPYDEILCLKGCVGMGIQQRHWNSRALDRAALVEVARLREEMDAEKNLHATTMLHYNAMVEERDEARAALAAAVAEERDLCIKATCLNCAFDRPFDPQPCGFPVNHVTPDGLVRCEALGIRARAGSADGKV